MRRKNGALGVRQTKCKLLDFGDGNHMGSVAETDFGARAPSRLDLMAMDLSLDESSRGNNEARLIVWARRPYYDFSLATPAHEEPLQLGIDGDVHGEFGRAVAVDEKLLKLRR